MVQRIQILLEDDKDGGPADQTVAFQLDGRDYEIDLRDANATALREAFAPWIAVARRTSGRQRRFAAAPGEIARHRRESKAIRAWAEERGIKVAPRGRIPQAVQDEYARETGAGGNR